jgi:hypothetical protein
VSRWLLLTGALLLLVGCGQTAAVDPLVGTWTSFDDPDINLTVSRQGSDYLVVSHKHGDELRIVFVRDGDSNNDLIAKQLPQGFYFKPKLHYYPASGHLHFSPFGKNVDLTQASTGSS